MDTTIRLERSRSDTMIAGVCGGLASYLHIDSTIVRLVFVLLAFSGPALLVYPLLWLVMPRERAGSANLRDVERGQVFVATGETQRLRLDPMTGAAPEPEEIPINNLGTGPATPPRAGRGKLLGYVLLGLGIFLTLQMIWPGLSSLIFPALLIAGGIYLLRRPA